MDAIQEYRACENSFQCTTYCNHKGFNDRVCKTVTVDESPNLDGTALVNRRVCLCSESSKFLPTTIDERWIQYNQCIDQISDLK